MFLSNIGQTWHACMHEHNNFNVYFTFLFQIDEYINGYVLAEKQTKVIVCIVLLPSLVPHIFLGFAVAI